MTAATEGPRRARRSPTADELRAWRSFIETSELVKSVIAGGLSDSGLSSGDYAVMLALSEQPARSMRSSHLADHMRWQRSRLSHHLGRMERRGLIARAAVEDDSRGAMVVLTDDGARLFRKASAPHMHDIHDAFVTALTPQQLAAVESAMTAVQAHLATRGSTEAATRP